MIKSFSGNKYSWQNIKWSRKAWFWNKYIRNCMTLFPENPEQLLGKDSISYKSVQKYLKTHGSISVPDKRRRNAEKESSYWLNRASWQNKQTTKQTKKNSCLCNFIVSVPPRMNYHIDTISIVPRGNLNHFLSKNTQLVFICYII